MQTTNTVITLSIFFSGFICAIYFTILQSPDQLVNHEFDNDDDDYDENIVKRQTKAVTYSSSHSLDLLWSLSST